MIFLNLMKLENLENKRILILGFGKEGRSTLDFLNKAVKAKEVAIADQNKTEIKGVRSYFGKDYLRAIKKYDVIIKTPGIPFKVIKPYVKKDTKITSQTEIFFNNCPSTIIGVTGTKGKSTTSSLIYSILKEAKLKAHLMGNIGKPALSYLLSAKKENIYVFELSSHQLHKIKSSPHISVLLNIYPEHLDYYSSYKEYINAKYNITKYQTPKDYFVFNSKNQTVLELSKKTKAKPVPFRKCRIRTDKIIHPRNMEAAYAVAKILDIKKEIVISAVKKFKTLPHRMEFAGEFKKVKYYNDSLATIPEATIFALESVRKVDTLICGGFDRGIDYSELATKIIKKKIRNLVLFKPSGEKIIKEVLKRKNLNYFFAKNMKEAVDFASSSTRLNYACLLSCASASFGLFKDYKDRGDQFKKYVKRIK